MALKAIIETKISLRDYMNPEREKEYIELDKFTEYYATYVLNIPRDKTYHPSEELIRITNEYGKSKALEGLKQATNDTIEDTSDWNIEKVKRIDSILRENGIIILSELRIKYWSKYKKILKNGKIKNDTEYYIIKAVLCDSPININSEEERILNELIRVYENQVREKRK
jgi:hypothetical protein